MMATRESKRVGWVSNEMMCGSVRVTMALYSEGEMASLCPFSCGDLLLGGLAPREVKCSINMPVWLTQS